jgi:decaprenylphospho-beta-D-ribofuranose 2-oxidase
VRIFNSVWFRKPLSTGEVHFKKFLHPLDPVREWNRVYGRRGFLQYQFVVPLESVDFLRIVLAEMKGIKAPSFISVLKKFEGPKGPYLSFPSQGWTLAIDIPIGVKGLDEVLNTLDSQLAEIGGRVYLAKDSRISKVNFRKMYPGYAQWLMVKMNMDPENYWQSDQGRRLGLC